VILRDGGGISMVRGQICSGEVLRDGVTVASEEGSGAEVILEEVGVRSFYLVAENQIARANVESEIHNYSTEYCECLYVLIPFSLCPTIE
jgi:hypothetical protein